jgi:hypothetical protein
MRTACRTNHEPRTDTSSRGRLNDLDGETHRHWEA